MVILAKVGRLAALNKTKYVSRHLYWSFSKVDIVSVLSRLMKKGTGTSLQRKEHGKTGWSLGASPLFHQALREIFFLFRSDAPLPGFQSFEQCVALLHLGPNRFALLEAESRIALRVRSRRCRKNEAWRLPTSRGTAGCSYRRSRKKWTWSAKFGPIASRLKNGCEIILRLIQGGQAHFSAA